MRIVVTGGAGFIGSTVSDALAAEGCDVVALDDLSTGRRSNSGDAVSLVEGSILDQSLLDETCKGASSVVHLAAQVSVPTSMDDPRSTHDCNVTGTLNVLEVAQRHGMHVIVASSAAVYGNSPEAVQHEDQLPRPTSPYAVSKLATEQYALTWQEAYGIPALALRFFNIYGPRQRPSDAYAAVVPAFVSRALTSRVLQVHGDGRQTRDFVSVSTVADVITRAVLDRTASPTPVNVAFGAQTNLLDLAGALEKIVGHPLRIEHVPARPGDIRASRGDGTSLRMLFPTIESQDLQSGLESTVNWFKDVLAER